MSRNAPRSQSASTGSVGRSSRTIVILLRVGAVELAERRPADDRPAYRREAPPRGLPGAVGPQHLRARDAAPRMRVRDARRARRPLRPARPRPDSRRARTHRTSPRCRGSRSRRATEAAGSRGRARPAGPRRSSAGRSRPRGSRPPARRARAGSRSSSAAWPCETTTAETFTAPAPRGRRRASSRPSPPT